MDTYTLAYSPPFSMITINAGNNGCADIPSAGTCLLVEALPRQLSKDKCENTLQDSSIIQAGPNTDQMLRRLNECNPKTIVQINRRVLAFLLLVISNNKMPSYLVIGGNGFLGQHVQEQIRLRQDGSSIAVFDMSEPREPKSDVKYYTGDLRNFEDVYNALEGITAVIHTASPPHVNTSNPPRDLYFSINVEGTLNIIKACQERKIKVLVVTSSGSVISNGEPMVNIDESTPYPPKAIDVYTESKVKSC